VGLTGEHVLYFWSKCPCRQLAHEGGFSGTRWARYY
jgi:hypothetical protein